MRQKLDRSQIVRFGSLTHAIHLTSSTNKSKESGFHKNEKY